MIFLTFGIKSRFTSLHFLTCLQQRKKRHLRTPEKNSLSATLVRTKAEHRHRHRPEQPHLSLSKTLGDFTVALTTVFLQLMGKECPYDAQYVS